VGGGGGFHKFTNSSSVYIKQATSNKQQATNNKQQTFFIKKNIVENLK
jgi:hypothetical protein